MLRCYEMQWLQKQNKLAYNQGCQYRSVPAGIAETFRAIKKTRQNGVVFVSVLIPVRSGNSGQIQVDVSVPFRP